MVTIEEEDLWMNAREIPLSCKTNKGNEHHDGNDRHFFLQMVPGRDPATHTLFGRVVESTSNLPPTASSSTTNITKNVVTVEQVVDQLAQGALSQTQLQQEQLHAYSARELLALGAVWKLLAPKDQDTVAPAKDESEEGNAPLLGGRKRRRRKRNQQHYPQQLCNNNDDCNRCPPKATTIRLSPSHAEDLLLPSRTGTGCSQQYSVVLRIHFQPSRYPIGLSSSTSSMIHHRDDDLGFCVANKPAGLPSHATVDNGVENLLSVLEVMLRQEPQPHQITSQMSKLRKSYKPSLPQRLDTETEGILLVATRPECASYLGRLLQQKSCQASVISVTGKHTDSSAMDDEGGTLTGTTPMTVSPPLPTMSTIHKHYRCLVCVNSTKDNTHVRDNDEDRHNIQQRFSLHAGAQIVHYMDPTSPAPKTFVSRPPPAGNDNQINDEKKANGWLKCVMNILTVGPVQQLASASSCWDGSVNGSGAGTTSATAPNPKLYTTATRQLVQEIVVELLTGRTHQIRGQFAAMQLPLVGDPLYNNGNASNTVTSWNTQRHRNRPRTMKGKEHQHISYSASRSPPIERLGLQCCFLSFPKPKWTSHRKTRRPRLESSATTTVPTTNHDANCTKSRTATSATSNDQEEVEQCSYRLDKAWWSDHLVDL